jgi:hypothetical protein
MRRTYASCGVGRLIRSPWALSGCLQPHQMHRCSKANEGALVDVARAETVDAELDRLISKRASQDRRLDPDEQEEIWKQNGAA